MKSVTEAHGLKRSKRNLKKIFATEENTKILLRYVHETGRLTNESDHRTSGQNN
jgi:hypothetical protein